MQELNIRKRNCRRFTERANPLINRAQQLQPVRCCGRVLTEQELSTGFLINGRGRGIGRGRGRGRANAQGQVLGRGISQGRGRANCRGRGRCMANGQDIQG